MGGEGKRAKNRQKRPRATLAVALLHDSLLYWSGSFPSAKPSFTMPRLTRKRRNAKCFSGAGEITEDRSSRASGVASLAFSAGGGDNGSLRSSRTGGEGWTIRSGHSSIVGRRGAISGWDATPTPSVGDHVVVACMAPSFKESALGAYAVFADDLQGHHANIWLSQRLIACVIICLPLLKLIAITHYIAQRSK